MAGINQLDLAKEEIETFFDNLETKAFSRKTLNEIILQNRQAWGISDKKPIHKIFDYLIGNTQFKIYELGKRKVYAWKTADELTIINGLKPNAYFSHYTSVFIHQLSLQIPKTVYLNFERPSPNAKGTLTQEAINQAFAKPQRKSESSINFNNKRISLLNGKFTNKLGVIEEQTENTYYCYTDIERTLIDIAVRPAYSGGVFEVIDIYRNVRELLDPKKLKNYLDQVDYIYPYHQVIGFYLDTAGYDKEVSALFLNKLNYDFYLTYDIRNKQYSQKWKLYYPKGINYEDD